MLLCKLYEYGKNVQIPYGMTKQRNITRLITINNLGKLISIDEVKENGETIFKSGELVLKSRGEQTEQAIINHACEYLIRKFGDLKIETERKVKSKEINFFPFN